MSWIRGRPVGVLLAGIVLGSTLVRFAAARGIHTPWIMPDEVIYAELGQSLYSSGRFEVLGEHIGFFGLVFPALVGGPLSVSDLERGYHWLKLLQALVMSLTAVPVYLWARSLARPGWALVAAGLTVALPGLAYSGLVMTEVAFYPALVLAAWALARALERPTAGRQGLLVGACALAAMTRLQAFVLLPVFVSAVALKAALDRRPREALRLWPAAVGLAALAAAWAAWRLAADGDLSALFGAYAPAGETRYPASEALRYALYHAADVLLLCGILPVCAVALLFGARREGGALTAYLATAVPLCAWLVLEVGVFASRHVGLLAERNLLSLAPVLFVGFAAWLDRGAPRPTVATALTCVAALLLVLALPVARFATLEAFPDAFTLQPLIEYASGRRNANVDLILAVAAAGALLLFALVPRRALAVLPALLAVAFVWISIDASREIVDRDRFVQAASTGPDRRWIDRNADGPVSYLFIGDVNWPAVWQHVFWNRRIERVYDLGNVAVPGGLPQTRVAPRPDGRLVGVTSDYIASLYPVAFVGRPVASVNAGIVLWRLDPPARISVWTQRVAGHVRVLAYDCTGGVLRLGLRGPVGADVELRRNGTAYRRVQVGAAGTWRGVIPAVPRSPGELCTFDVRAPPEVIAPTVAFER
ncbi:MAG: glycosyltransferase family 39 protein [Actinomycetota bacterium]|nr:glycosyltransferase family 39 protein [Actinomycetota bacterium]